MAKYETIGSRLGALFTDSILIIPISAIISYLLWAFTGFNIALIMSTFILAYLIQVFYYIYFHAKGGQTFGKRIFEVKVVDHISESEITLQQAIFRSIPQLLQLLFLILVQISFNSPNSTTKMIFISFSKVFFLAVILWHTMDLLSALASEKCRTLHDRIAGTVVIDIQ